MSRLDLVIDAIALAWILYPQRRPRRVRLHFAGRVPVFLSLLGLVQFVHFTETHAIGAAVSAITIGSCVVGGALWGILRGATVRLFPLSKGVGQQATWLTIALWVISAATHLLLSPAVSSFHGSTDALSASLLLYFALSLGVQNAVVHHRAVQFLRRGVGRQQGQILNARSWEARTD